jgi:hypothetical protein
MGYGKVAPAPFSMIVSGLGIGAALTGKKRKATRDAKTSATLRRTIERRGSFFIGIVLHL